MKDIKHVFEEKLNNKWTETWQTTNELVIYKKLSHDLIAKKINKCSYIKSIKRVQNYDGTITIIVLYSTGAARSIYTIKEH